MGAVQTLPESNHTPGKNICTWIKEKERKKGRREKERKAELVRNEKGKEKEKEGEWVEENRGEERRGGDKREETNRREGRRQE